MIISTGLKKCRREKNQEMCKFKKNLWRFKILRTSMLEQVIKDLITDEKIDKNGNRFFSLIRITKDILASVPGPQQSRHEM